MKGQQTSQPQPENGLPRTAIVIAALLVTTILIAIAALGAHLLKTRAEERERREARERQERQKQTENLSREKSKDLSQPSPAPVEIAGGPAISTTQPILYRDMSLEQQYNFLDHRGRQIARMMGNQGTAFEKEVLGYIKHYVDVYAGRVGNGSNRVWGEDLNFLFQRGAKNAPYIIASFRRERVPVVIGLYIPVIESEYRECLRSPVGALGMFQFMEKTAIEYGVDPADRCRVEKMAPAAARYMKDRIREFGTDAMSVALSIAGYNRSPQSVRRDLQDVIDSKNNERSFWTLLARKEELDHFFQKENVKYVPKFFAAAIVGENPEAFGLRIRKLSTYDQNSP